MVRHSMSIGNIVQRLRHGPISHQQLLSHVQLFMSRVPLYEGKYILYEELLVQIRLLLITFSGMFIMRLQVLQLMKLSLPVIVSLLVEKGNIILL